MCLVGTFILGTRTMNIVLYSPLQIQVYVEDEGTNIKLRSNIATVTVNIIKNEGNLLLAGDYNGNVAEDENVGYTILTVVASPSVSPLICYKINYCRNENSTGKRYYVSLFFTPRHWFY